MRGDAVLAADPALQKQLDAYVEHSKVLATACRLPLLGVDKGFGVRHAPVREVGGRDVVKGGAVGTASWRSHATKPSSPEMV